MEQMAMQTESWDMRRDLAAEALAAEGAMKRLAEQSPSSGANFEEDSVAPPAMSGLALATALSLPFWAAIAVLLWRLLR